MRDMPLNGRPATYRPCSRQQAPPPKINQTSARPSDGLLQRIEAQLGRSVSMTWPVIFAIRPKSLSTAKTVRPAFSAVAATSRSGTEGSINHLLTATQRPLLLGRSDREQRGRLGAGQAKRRRFSVDALDRSRRKPANEHIGHRQLVGRHAGAQPRLKIMSSACPRGT